MNIHFKAGFVSIIGKPNVGKSTLMNKILKEKISIISPKPQTTRQQVKGIYNDNEKQIIFLDTPGFVEARYELHNKMLEYLMRSISDSDLIIFITDAHHYPTDYDKKILEILKSIRKPKIAILNKIDLVDDFDTQVSDLEKLDFIKVIPISILQINDFDFFLESIAEHLPENPPFFDPEEISDLPIRFFVQEIVREQIFLNYSDELPYASTVVVEKYQDFDNKVKIYANIWLERKSQKPIILGKNGTMIKKIRLASEKEIHKIVRKRVKLDLWIKIKPNWRKKKNALKEFGYR